MTKLLALDTETTGLDLYHAARPFFVTICDEEGNQRWWQWNVDPLTREVNVEDQDRCDIAEVMDEAEVSVLQNPKFDCAALAAIGLELPWDKVFDTLTAGHVLASNQPHNLTAMALHWLGVDVQPFEDRLKMACNEARRFCRSKRKDWLIAEAGLEGIPSAKSGSNRDKKGVESESPWKFDCWLPRAVAVDLGLPVPQGDCKHAWEKCPDTVFRYGERCRKCRGHRWHLLLEEYANSDSAVTAALWPVMRADLERRGLWDIYLWRLHSQPLAFNLEHVGVTGSIARAEELKDHYDREVDVLDETCRGIASRHNHDLILPKGASNHNLLEFCFQKLKLPVQRWTDKGNPGFDKGTLEEWEKTLPDGDGKDFIAALRRMRKIQKAAGDIQTYRRYWLPLNLDGQVGDFFILHPNLNPTGTATLRWSCSNPNEQNIAKEEQECQLCEGEDRDCLRCRGTGKELRSMRWVFGPAPGREWWSLDGKNLELRLPFYKAGEPALIELFERPDDPPYYGSVHLANCHLVYRDLWDKVAAEVGADQAGPTFKKRHEMWYKRGKNGGFAIQYGCQRAKADATFGVKGAFDLINGGFKRLAKLKAEVMRFAEVNGYVETMPSKAIDPERGYPLLCTRTEYGSILPTIPFSYYIQGTAMQWTHQAQMRCQDQLDEWRRRDGFDGFMTMQVHDEIVFDLPRQGNPVAESKMRGGKGPLFRTSTSSNLWRVKVLQRLMEQGGDDIEIPTPVGVVYHPENWAEGVTIA